ncbi:aminotransferase class I/II-fold pyridoxal phosphate-dependent enzyme [Lichenicoccus roseus]|uniref:aminotransferase class I/II-fold pyridoxal phosphate-dependent enzyme n=1 Tax=Lichenicoccus roseus TaxID=2683649 RepID=UPI00197F5126|nr:8-amino-7-oxononanoate synthase [Lichenicoccus roseus]
MGSRFDRLFEDALQALSDRSLRRSPRAVHPDGAGRLRLDGRTLLNLSGNDYLGLSQHPAVIARAVEWTRLYGTGAGASRLVSGTLQAHVQVEARLAAFKKCDAALLFASGWQANAAVLPALLRAASGAGQGEGRGEPLVFTDRLNHASLHQGCAAAGVRQIRYRHNDLDHLERLLASRRQASGTRFIITESVFSMDGDRADLTRLATLAQAHEAFLFVDEAHATGVLGPGGRGLAAGIEGIDCVMGTLSKAFGSFGAYVAGSRPLCDLLVNSCSGFIHSTALPPPVLGAIDAALDLLPGMEDERAHLATQSARLRAVLLDLGIGTAGSTTQIVPALLGPPERALAASAALEREGVLTTAIRPPTVPANTSRLRFALSALHDEAAIGRLIELLPGCLREAA